MQRNVLIIGSLIAVCVFFITVPKETGASLFPDGLLVRPEGGFNVYYIEKGVKRLIGSAQAFITQGFEWNDIRIVNPNDTLTLFPEGNVLTAASNIVMPGEEEFLPDLIPFPAEDVRLTKHKGRTILKFTSNFWNGGRGPIELIPELKTTGATGDIMREVYQRIPRSDGSYRDRFVGSFLWHTVHDHYHFEDFADHIFESLDHVTPTRILQEKTSRCLWDTKAVALYLPGAPREKSFTSCENRERQGISVGWGDVYDYTLADQYLDVHDLPPGIYRLTLEIDPRSLFTEIRKDNNKSVVFIRLDAPRGIIKILGAVGPFESSANILPDGTLIREEGTEKIYITHNNKKRWIKTEHVFTSYGYLWDDIREVPPGIVDAVPYNNLVSLDGLVVYALNDLGYTRHIQNPDIFASYNFHWEDIARISEEEFAQYLPARLVRVVDSPHVYYIDGTTLRRISNPLVLTENGFLWDEIHVINQADFSSYSLGLDITTKSIAP